VNRHQKLIFENKKAPSLDPVLRLRAITVEPKEAVVVADRPMQELSPSLFTRSPWCRAAVVPCHRGAMHGGGAAPWKSLDLGLDPSPPSLLTSRNDDATAAVSAADLTPKDAVVAALEARERHHSISTQLLLVLLPQGMELEKMKPCRTI
jgi:hypothetical protein